MAAKVGQIIRKQLNMQGVVVIELAQLQVHESKIGPFSYVLMCSEVLRGARSWDLNISLPDRKTDNRQT